MTSPPRPALAAILAAVIGVAVAIVVARRAHFWERFSPAYLSSRYTVFHSLTPASVPAEPGNRRRVRQRRANRRHRPAATAVASPHPPASAATPIAGHVDESADANLQAAADLAVSFIVRPAAVRPLADRFNWRTHRSAMSATPRPSLAGASAWPLALVIACRVMRLTEPPAARSARRQRLRGRPGAAPFARLTGCKPEPA